MQKREKIALGLFIFGVIWYFAENTYFGWNQKPINMWEGIADFLIWVFWGLAFFIKPSNKHVTEYKVEKATFNMLGETNINKNREG